MRGIKLLDPNKLVIVGLDVPVDDENRVLEDADSNAAEVAPDLVTDVLARGVDTPAKVRQRAGRMEVVFGRHRVRAARKARELEVEDKVPEEGLTLVPVLFVKADVSDLDLRRMLVAENLGRRVEDVVAQARKAQSLLDLGDEPARVAALCRVSRTTLKDWGKLLKLHPEVLELVRAGQVGSAPAVKLLKGVSKERQPDEMRRLVAEGRAGGLAAEAEVAARNGAAAYAEEPDDEPGGEPDPDAGAPVVPGKRALRAFASHLKANVHRDDVFTRKQVSGLLAHVLDGAPLKGPFREHWRRSQQAKQT